MARNFAERFNHRYGDVLPSPQPFNFGSELVKIMSLDGNGKMSKSENQMATIYLADEDEAVRKKIMKAKTDSGPTEPNAIKPDYIQNLFTLMGIVSEQQVQEKFNEDFNKCVIRYGDMKKQLAEDMVNFIRPIREKAADIQNNKEMLEKIIKTGAEKSRASASKTLAEVRKAMVMNY
jgi:tryptophanyl-tRNA synthetase